MVRMDGWETLGRGMDGWMDVLVMDWSVDLCWVFEITVQMYSSVVEL